MYNIDISYIPHEHINIYLVSLGLVTLPVKEGTAVKISPNFAMNFERKPLSANGIKKLKPCCTYDFFYCCIQSIETIKSSAMIDQKYFRLSMVTARLQVNVD